MYGYVGNNPLINVDSEGLFVATCRIPPRERTCGTRPPCVGITNSYAAEYERTGNKLDQCASCVSAAICLVIIGLGGEDSRVPRGIANTIANGLQCQNSCMAKLRFAGTARASGISNSNITAEAWRRAQIPCNDNPSGIDCCRASVNAEQLGYNVCAPTCGLIGRLLSLIPYSARVNFAIDVLDCCS